MNKIPMGQSVGCAVNKYIGSDFDHVINVSENMEHVETVSENITDVKTVSTNIDDIKHVASNLDNYQIDEVIVLGTNQQDVIFKKIWVPMSRFSIAGSMVDGTDLFEGEDYTVVNPTTIKLLRTYPKGTILKGLQAIYDTEEPNIIIDDGSAFNRKIQALVDGESFTTYEEDGRTLTPRLYVGRKQYVPMFDLGDGITFTSGIATDNGDGSITVQTTKGTRKFSCIDAEAITRKELVNTKSEIITEVQIQYWKSIGDIRGWGGGLNVDNTPALLAALKDGVKKIQLVRGLNKFSPVDITELMSGMELIGQGGGYAHTAQTLIVPMGAQDYIFQCAKNVGGADNISFRDLRFDCMSICKRALNQLSGAGWNTGGTVSFFNHTEWGWWSEQGLNKYGRIYCKNTYIDSHGEKQHSLGGIAAYSDFWMDELESTGGYSPVRVMAGGGRIGKLLANTGIDCSLNLSPLDSNTNHINTAIESAYLGETANTSNVTVPVIMANSVGNRKVRNVQITNLFTVHAATSVNSSMGMMRLRGCEDWLISNWSALGQWTYATSSRRTDYVLDAENCSNITISSGQFKGITKNNFIINKCDGITIGSSVKFVDFGSDTLSNSGENAAILIKDNSKVVIEDGVEFTIKTGNSKAFALKVVNGVRCIFGKMVIDYPNATTVEFDSNSTSYGIHRLGVSKAIYKEITIDNGIFSGVNKATSNYIHTGTVQGTGNQTVKIFTLDNSKDTNYTVFIQQAGTGRNSAYGFACCGTSGTFAKTITNSNTNIALSLEISTSNKDLMLTVGSGYGVTTFIVTICKNL